MDPIVEAQQQLVMERQFQEHMGREMAMFVAQRKLEAGLSDGPVRPLTTEVGVRSRELSAPAPTSGAPGYSGAGDAPPGTLVSPQAVSTVCSPQVQEWILGSGSRVQGRASEAVVDAVVPRRALGGVSQSDDQRLRELRDGQRRVEQQDAVLRVQAPVFVPGQ